MDLHVLKKCNDEITKIGAKMQWKHKLKNLTISINGSTMFSKSGPMGTVFTSNAYLSCY